MLKGCREATTHSVYSCYYPIYHLVLERFKNNGLIHNLEFSVSICNLKDTPSNVNNLNYRDDVAEAP